MSGERTDPEPVDPDSAHAAHADDDISGLDDTVDGLLQVMARVSDRPLPLSISPTDPDIGKTPELVEEVARDRYTVGAEVGRGGMGRVVVAQDRRLGRRVAIKELLHAGGIDRSRFVREALITARLQHPAIVPVHEAGRWPSGEPFYAMKLVSGRPLSNIIEESTTPSARLALLPVVLAVADAMAYAHHQRVIHRDLKPSNVIVGEFGETVVIDWGLAKPLDEPTELTTQPGGGRGPGAADAGAPGTPGTPGTMTGALLGTPGFMSPEQARGQPADERSDVFALGALLYAVLAGRAPYRGRTINETLALTLAGPPLPLPKIVPVDLVAIVDKALAPLAKDRYADAQAMAADLRLFSTGQLVRAHRYSRLERLVRLVRRHRALFATVGLALAVLAVVGFVSVRQIVRERDRANAERASALLRLDQLVLSQARAHVADDPTLGLSWLTRLTPTSALWRSARGVATQVRERGVAFDGARGRVVSFSPDGTHVATVDGEGRVHLYEWQPGIGTAQELPGRVGRGRAVVFSADGTRLAASGDAGVHLYATASRQTIRLAHDVGDVSALAFLAHGVGPYGDALAAGDESGVHLWSRDGASLPVPSAWPSAAVESLAAAGARLAWRDRHAVWIWDGDPLVPPRRWPVSAGGALALSASHVVFVDGSTLKFAALDEDRLRSVPLANVAALALPTAASTSLVTCGADGVVVRVDLGSGDMTALAHVGEPCHTAAATSTGTRMAATRGTMTRVWGNHADVHKLRTDGTNVASLAFSPDGHWLASASENDIVRLWAVDQDENQQAPPGAVRYALDGNGHGVALTHDGRLERFDGTGLVAQVGALVDLQWGGPLVGTVGDNGIALYDAQTGGLRLRLDEKPARLALSRDGRTLVTVGENGLVQTRTLDADRAGPPTTVTLLVGARTVALSPDGTLIAVARQDARTVQLFDRAVLLHTFEIDNPITALAFVDSDLLAIGASDGGVRFGQLSTRQLWPLFAVDKSAVVTMAASETRLDFLLSDGQISVRTNLPPGDPAALQQWVSGLSRARLGDHDEVRFSE